MIRATLSYSGGREVPSVGPEYQARPEGAQA
jgi:hypothetical protein